MWSEAIRASFLIRTEVLTIRPNYGPNNAADPAVPWGRAMLARLLQIFRSRTSRCGVEKPRREKHEASSFHCMTEAGIRQRHRREVCELDRVGLLVGL